jgi:probable F420-dependent oxidoreductase
MKLGRVGIWSGELRFHRETQEIAEAAAELEQLGYGTLWVPGGIGGNIFGAATRLLESTRSSAVATGILNIWMHEPADVAERRARIEDDHPGRFLLGLGVSHGPLVDSKEPGRYRRPLAKMRSYLDALDEAATPVPVDARMLASLGLKSLEIARERSAGSHPYFIPVEHSAFARDRLGRDRLLAPEQAVMLESDPETARARAREFMSGYLQLPNYTDALKRFGFGEDDLRDGGSDRLVDAIVAWGDEDAVARRVAAHHDAGADHVCIQVVGAPKGTLPLESWRRLAPALTAA